MPQTLTSNASSPRMLDGDLGSARPGSAIPGSRFFREYCTACGVAIRVPRNQVGKRCLCDHCRDNHARLD